MESEPAPQILKSLCPRPLNRPRSLGRARVSHTACLLPLSQNPPSSPVVPGLGVQAGRVGSCPVLAHLMSFGGLGQRPARDGPWQLPARECLSPPPPAPGCWWEGTPKPFWGGLQRTSSLGWQPLHSCPLGHLEKHSLTAGSEPALCLLPHLPMPSGLVRISLALGFLFSRLGVPKRSSRGVIMGASLVGSCRPHVSPPSLAGPFLGRVPGAGPRVQLSSCPFLSLNKEIQ